MAKIQLTTTRAAIGAPQIGRTSEPANPDLVAAQALIALGEQFVGIAKTIEQKTEEGAVKAANDVFASTQVWKPDGSMNLAASIAATEQLIRNPEEYLTSRLGEGKSEAFARHIDFNKMRLSAIESADALYYDVGLSTRTAFQNALTEQGYNDGTYLAATDVIENLENVSSKIRNPHLKERLNISRIKHSLLANIERSAERQGPEVHLALAADVIGGKYDAFDPDYTTWESYVDQANTALKAQFYATQEKGGGFSVLAGSGIIEGSTDEIGNTTFRLTDAANQLIASYEELPEGKTKDRLKSIINQQISTQLPKYESISRFWEYDPDGPNNVTDTDFIVAQISADDPIFNEGIDLVFAPRIAQLSLYQQVEYLKLSLLKMQNLSGAVPEAFKNHVLEGLRDPSRLKYTVMALEDLESSLLYSSDAMISKEEKLARRFNISRFLDEEYSIRVDLLRIALAQGLDPLTAKGTVDSWLEADVTAEDIKRMDANMVWEKVGAKASVSPWVEQQTEFREAMLLAYTAEGADFDTSAFVDYSGPEIDEFVASLAIRQDFETLARSKYMVLLGRGMPGSKTELRTLALNHAATELVRSGVVPIGGRLRRVPLEVAQMAGLKTTNAGSVGRFIEAEILSGMAIMGYKNIDYTTLREFDFLYQSTSAGDVVVSIVSADMGDPARMYKDTGEIWQPPGDPDRDVVEAKFIMTKWDDSFLGNLTAAEGVFQNFARLDYHRAMALDPQNVSAADTNLIQDNIVGLARDFISADQIGAEPGPMSRGYRLGFQNPMRDVYVTSDMRVQFRATKKEMEEVMPGGLTLRQYPLAKTNYSIFISGGEIDPTTGRKQYIKLTPSKPMIAYLDPVSWDELEKQGLSGLPLIMEASEKYVKDNDIEKMSVFAFDKFMNDKVPDFRVINTEDGTLVTDFYWKKGRSAGENLLRSDKLFEALYGRSASGEESIFFSDVSKDRGKE